MQSHEIFKSNIRLYLEWIGVTPYTAAIATGHGPSWFSGILNPKRHQSKISSIMIDEVAEALELAPHKLLDPNFQPRRNPSWLKKVLKEREERESGSKKD
jgi:hypothetical protein